MWRRTHTYVLHIDFEQEISYAIPPSFLPSFLPARALGLGARVTDVNRLLLFPSLPLLLFLASPSSSSSRRRMCGGQPGMERGGWIARGGGGRRRSKKRKWEVRSTGHTTLITCRQKEKGDSPVKARVTLRRALPREFADTEK